MHNESETVSSDIAMDIVTRSHGLVTATVNHAELEDGDTTIYWVAVIINGVIVTVINTYQQYSAFLSVIEAMSGSTMALNLEPFTQEHLQRYQ
jgi:hypothetical protein